MVRITATNCCILTALAAQGMIAPDERFLILKPKEALCNAPTINGTAQR
jgi:hypothetical protein